MLKFTTSIHKELQVVSGTTPQRAQQRLRILLAEDNRINQIVAEKILQSMGHECFSVGDGMQVLDIIGKTPFDAILMDCQMPELDGFETTKRIRTAEKQSKRHIPIIALTASSQQADREHCLQCGMDSYLAKPFRKEELAKMLELISSL